MNRNIFLSKNKLFSLCDVLEKAFSQKYFNLSISVVGILLSIVDQFAI